MLNTLPSVLVHGVGQNELENRSALFVPTSAENFAGKSSVSPCQKFNPEKVSSDSSTPVECIITL